MKIFKNFKHLKCKDFFLLSFGGLVSIIGTLIQDLALSLYILKVTGSATQFAAVISMEIIPHLFLAPLSGVLIDRIDRKKIIVYTDLFSGIIIGLYAILFYINGSLSIISIYILVIILSINSMFFKPAIKTIIPSIVSNDELVSANTCYSTIRQMGCLIAPALGGILYGSFGLFFVLIINSTSFILSGISEMFINIPQKKHISKNKGLLGFKEDILEGLHFVQTNKIVRSLLMTTGLLSIAEAGCVTIGYIYIAKMLLKVSDFQYGLVGTAGVLGGLIALVVIGFLTENFTLYKIIAKSTLITSVIYFLTAIIFSKLFLSIFSNIFIAFINLLILNLSTALVATLMNISIQVELQKQIPNSMLGRVFTLQQVTISIAIFFTQIIFGVLFDKLEISTCIFIGALFAFWGAIKFSKNLSKFNELDYSLEQ